MNLPQYISKHELLQRLERETSALPAKEAAWWISHVVEPFIVAFKTDYHFVVAQAEKQCLFFADDENEFGVGCLDGNPPTLHDYGLAGDLVDAIRCIWAAAEQASAFDKR